MTTRIAFDPEEEKIVVNDLGKKIINRIEYGSYKQLPC